MSDSLYDSSFSIKYDKLVNEERWDLVATMLKDIFGKWYNHGLMTSKLVEIKSYISEKDPPNFCVDMLIEETDLIKQRLEEEQEELRRLYEEAVSSDM